MNIKEAKEQIRKTCLAYLTKDEFGDYAMPSETQRPVFLVGAPGIGKTAIMSQVADELGLGLVDYSMTHHTRQSAIGLPFITHREFDGQVFDVSEYTMSEIIASVYETMERTGKREGILFLDEINCVSETLEPAMLRFLQNKVFGNHRVPEGWIVVSAGNPLEFNRSARQFDIVTLDRVKKMEVDPDYPAWREYAVASGAHQAVVSYLDLKPDNFYRVEKQGRSRTFVTARAWMDLSSMMKLYERNGLATDEALIGQYVQIPSVAKDFFAYVELFAAYSRDYRINDIVEGRVDDELLSRAKSAGYDERIALAGLLCDAVNARAEKAMTKESALRKVRASLTAAKESAGDQDLASLLEQRAGELEQEIHDNALHFHQHPDERVSQHETVRILRNMATATSNSDSPFSIAATCFNDLLRAQKEEAELTKARIGHVLSFASEAYGDGNEVVMMLSELTLHKHAARFIERYGSDEYQRLAARLMLDERAQELDARVQKLDEALDLLG